MMRTTAHVTYRGIKSGYIGVPKIRCTFLGVPLIKIIVYWGLYWGPLFWGNYHIGVI